MITSIRELRRMFWAENPNLPKRKIIDYSGKGKMHQTDTRCAWADWIDFMQKDGQISEDMANRATL